MKNTAITTTLLFLAVSAFAQNNLSKSDDIARVAIAPYVSDQVENFPESAKGMLAGKFASILTANGISGVTNSRFVMTANIVVTSKDITPTAPPMHAYGLEATFFIADAVGKKAFSSVSFSLKGVDVNETKAYINAIKNIKTDDLRLKSFVEEGKKKIIEYYNKECDFILSRAQTASDQNKHGEAISMLTSVPEVCDECFNKAMKAVAPIYKKFMEQDCKKRLLEAKGVWSASQNITGAEKAGNLLSGIDPEASCYGEAESFVSEVKKRVYELDKREWDFMLQVQKDATDIEKEQLKSCRDIGVAYGENQPQTVSYDFDSWLW